VCHCQREKADTDARIQYAMAFFIADVSILYLCHCQREKVDTDARIQYAMAFYFADVSVLYLCAIANAKRRTLMQEYSTLW